MTTTAEALRLTDAKNGTAAWRAWGPYLSERQWGTVREDYSPGGTAWSYLSHDQARSRAYRWGEDGIAGISDDRQRLCFAIALWNTHDPILKERLFGLTNDEGNHGEDVKEYYFYLDNTPTHSYMKLLYKYPQAAYPYADLVQVNGARKSDPRSFEYELIDTGVFSGNRYFDVFVEYAKASPTDILIRVTATNRGPDAVPLHVLPTLWFRNTWSWNAGQPKPAMQSADGTTIEAVHQELGTWRLYCEKPGGLLFVENESNAQRLWGSANQTPYPKDGINDCIVGGNKAAVNPQAQGTKAAAHYALTLKPGETQVIRLRLSSDPAAAPFGQSFDATFAARIAEADDFYRTVVAPYQLTDDRRLIQRQALAGMLWSKQVYIYPVSDWLDGDGDFPPPSSRLGGRNSRWRHMYAEDVISMPDKWEYPWFASWDLSFHTVALALVDPDFAKDQLLLLMREWYMSPEGQVPAYEWSFDDVNPPVQAWAARRVYALDKARTGRGDLAFLQSAFQHCLLYFTWWVNRKDADGNNLFQGGFLGLDNIGVFDRNQQNLFGGARLYQADGSSWMGLFALEMMEMARELATADPDYVSMAAKFFQHFLYLADSMNHVARMSEGEADLWNDDVGLYCDVLRMPDGSFRQLPIHSLVGLMPLYPAAAIDRATLESEDHAVFKDRFEWFIRQQPWLVSKATQSSSDSLLLCFATPDRLRRILSRMLDEREFLGPFGIRAISKFHEANPYTLALDGASFTLDYEPAESTSGTFGGNSNWRGPIWAPVNFLLVDSLRRFHAHLGDSFTMECPTGSGVRMNLAQVADELSRRLVATFERGTDGRRPVFGGNATFQQDPFWKDNILFYEYFHGDNGAGLGASHQTGWTGVIAAVIHELGVGQVAAEMLV